MATQHRNIFNFIQQAAYLRFDNITARYAKGIMNGTHWIDNTPDAGLFNYDVMFFYKVRRERQQLLVTTPIDEKDESYSRVLLQTAFDSCKVAAGTLPTIINRMTMQNHNAAMNRNYSCPFPKNVHIRLINNTFTDTLLPFLPDEKRFRIQTNFSGVLEGKKGMVKLYTVDLFGRYKKTLI